MNFLCSFQLSLEFRFFDSLFVPFLLSPSSDDPGRHLRRPGFVCILVTRELDGENCEMLLRIAKASDGFLSTVHI